MEITITVEQVEALASQLEASEQEQRQKALRLIRAYARILGAREPERFRRRPTECRDEAGHWDSSYPPREEYTAHAGPRLVTARKREYQDVPTSGGFYYAWKRVTTDPGVYIARDGTIYGCDEHGTGTVGQYAAHPGDCEREIVLDWTERDPSDVPTAELLAAEEHLRGLAFPASVKAVDKPAASA